MVIEDGEQYMRREHVSILEEYGILHSPQGYRRILRRESA
jgi:hypothetical protein